MLALALVLLAAPGWAGKPDSADASGHTFTCEGQGKTDEDALQAAQAICNDKICKVCGVEVESITETKETLKGVDFQRKVVERCRRVRSGDTKVDYKSSDCGPDGCTAWIQIRYGKEDEARECPAYTREDFADPAACEADVTAFSRVAGRTAASFHERTRLLDEGLVHCAKIDVRQTPALMALDSKLNHGLESFEYAPRERDRDDRFARSFWTYHVARYEPLHREISESRLFTERLRLARDYVHDRALAWDIIEAATAGDWDSPQGLERLRAAMEKAPPGSHYGAPPAHLVALFDLQRAKSDTSAINALLRRLYPPDRLAAEDSWRLALFFAGDDQVTEDEWRYMMAFHRLHRCDNCLRVLLQAQRHGGDSTRLARFEEAWKSLPDKARDTPKRALSSFENLIGYQDATLLLLVAPQAPAEVRAGFGWKLYSEFITRFDSARKKTSPEARRAILQLAVASLAAEPLEHGACSSLADRLSRAAAAGGDLGPAAERICACLGGPLRAEGEGYVNKSDLQDVAARLQLGCGK